MASTKQPEFCIITTFDQSPKGIRKCLIEHYSAFDGAVATSETLNNLTQAALDERVTALLADEWQLLYEYNPKDSYDFIYFFDRYPAPAKMKRSVLVVKAISAGGVAPNRTPAEGILLVDRPEWRQFPSRSPQLLIGWATDTESWRETIRGQGWDEGFETARNKTAYGVTLDLRLFYFARKA